MIGIKEAGFVLGSSLCLAEHALPDRTYDEGNRALPQNTNVFEELNRRPPPHGRLYFLTLKDFSACLEKLLFCEVSDLPLTLQEIVLQQREEFLGICAAHKKATPLMQIMNEGSARLWLSTESMVAEFIKEAKALVELTNILQSIDQISTNPLALKKADELRHELGQLKEEWENLDDSWGGLQSLRPRVETLFTQARIENDLEVLSAELDFVTGLETDLKLVKGFREPLDRAHELSRRVAELRIEAFHGPARPEEIEAWRKSLDTSIQTAVAKTLGIFSEINFKPAEGLRLLNPTN
jgi:hypothetical protein